MSETPSKIEVTKDIGSVDIVTIIRKIQESRGDVSDLIEKYREETENQEINKNLKIINYPFDKYIITVVLTKENEFLGIVEIRINKDFRSFKQKSQSGGFADIMKYYPDE